MTHLGKTRSSPLWKKKRSVLTESTKDMTMRDSERYEQCMEGDDGQHDDEDGDDDGDKVMNTDEQENEDVGESDNSL